MSNPCENHGSDLRSCEDCSWYNNRYFTKNELANALDKLKEKVNEQIDGGMHKNAYDDGWDDALASVIDMIDNILSEGKSDA